MSDFLLVVPEGWVQLDWEFISNNITGFSASSVAQWATVDMMLIEQPLKDAGLIPLTSTVQAVKLMDDTYFLVQLG